MFSNPEDHCENTNELNFHLRADAEESKPIVIIYGFMPEPLYNSLCHTDSEEEDYVQAPIVRLFPFKEDELVVMAKAEFRKQVGHQVNYASDIDDKTWATFLKVGPYIPKKPELMSSGLGHTTVSVSGSDMVSNPKHLPANQRAADTYDDPGSDRDRTSTHRVRD